MSSSHTRRSTRIKKFIYGTLNQQLLGKHFITRAFLKTHSIPKKTFHLHKDKNSKLHKDIYGDIIKDNDLISLNSSESEDVDDDVEEGVDGKISGRTYFLREHKPLTQRFEIEPVKHRQSKYFPLSSAYKSRSRTNNMPSIRSTNKAPLDKSKSKLFMRHSSSTSDTSLSSSSESINHKRFRQRERKSLLKSRSRCLPLNFQLEDISKSYVLKDRLRIGSSLADIEPMTIDPNITFRSIGGLAHHVDSLKEMVIFPLLYPEVFQAFDIVPPRGVLFHGPPGTGKTLLARALANECGLTAKATSSTNTTNLTLSDANTHQDALLQGSRNKISFFMRKGSDCLSKWVGESERQLRMLFDQAYKMRPSIIFFDEIDGLAPVRSSRQEQIHNSIVSTFLALLDGLDSRCNIVVIGATNRLDAIDPAFRRPGRFDREFLFPMPNYTTREKIIKIHTQKWKPLLSSSLLQTLASQTTGFTGADIKGLCTEAAILALRARYPQIYASQHRLPIDVNSIKVKTSHFRKAYKTLIPSTLRQNKLWTRKLPDILVPLLQIHIENALQGINKVFPSLITAAKRSQDGTDFRMNGLSSYESSGSSSASDDGIHFEDIDLNYTSKRLEITAEPLSSEATISPRLLHNDLYPIIPVLQRNFVSDKSQAFKPRFILSGTSHQGHTSYIGPAILNRLDGIPLHVIDVPALYGCSSRMPEEACSEIFREVQRITPSVLYLPCINEWWSVLTDTTKAAFTTLLHGLPPFASILILATSDTPFSLLPPTIQQLFDQGMGNLYDMRNPFECERREFYTHIIRKLVISFRKKMMKRLLPTNKETKNADECKYSQDNSSLCGNRTFTRGCQNKQDHSHEMTVFVNDDVRELSSSEIVLLRQQEENTLCELRIFLRDILNQLFRERKFQIFSKPVNPELVPDYYQIIQKPMDLSGILSKIDAHKYCTSKDFMADIELICQNALEYNPGYTAGDKSYRHRACALLDTAKSLIYKQLEPEFEKLCVSIAQSRRLRGEISDLPPFFKVVPKASKWNVSNFMDTNQIKLPSRSNPYPDQHDFTTIGSVNFGNHFKQYKKNDRGCIQMYMNDDSHVKNCCNQSAHDNNVKRIFPSCFSEDSQIHSTSRTKKIVINKRQRGEKPWNSGSSNWQLCDTLGHRNQTRIKTNGEQHSHIQKNYFLAKPKKTSIWCRPNRKRRFRLTRSSVANGSIEPSITERQPKGPLSIDQSLMTYPPYKITDNLLTVLPKFETEDVDMGKVAATPISLSPTTSLGSGSHSFDYDLTLQYSCGKKHLNPGPIFPKNRLVLDGLDNGNAQSIDIATMQNFKLGSHNEIAASVVNTRSSTLLIVERIVDDLAKNTDGWTVEALEKIAFKIINNFDDISIALCHTYGMPGKFEKSYKRISEENLVLSFDNTKKSENKPPAKVHFSGDASSPKKLFTENHPIKIFERLAEYEHLIITEMRKKVLTDIL